MKVLTIPHSLARRRELFGWIGESCASTTVRNNFGAPITSALGDMWFIAVDGDTLLGFCSIHPLKSKSSGHLNGFYVFDPRRGSVPTALLQAAEDFAATEGMETLLTVCPTNVVTDRESQGWVVVGDRGKLYKSMTKQLRAKRVEA